MILAEEDRKFAYQVFHIREIGRNIHRRIDQI
jgi:hypothetical protein